jgi:hypothetical protein
MLCCLAQAMRKDEEAENGERRADSGQRAADNGTPLSRDQLITELRVLTNRYLPTVRLLKFHVGGTETGKWTVQGGAQGGTPVAPVASASGNKVKVLRRGWLAIWSVFVSRQSFN